MICDSGVEAGAWGFAVNFGLVTGFGPQSLFLIEHGLRGERIGLAALGSTVGDLILFIIGIFAGTALFTSIPWLRNFLLWAGMLYIGLYGVRLLIAGGGSATVQQGSPLSGHGTLALSLSFGLLNPRAWLDALVVLGGLAGGCAPALRLWLLGGAVLASALWFIALELIGCKCAVLAQRSGARRVVATVEGLLMLGLAALLLRGV